MELNVWPCACDGGYAWDKNVALLDERTKWAAVLFEFEFVFAFTVRLAATIGGGCLFALNFWLLTISCVSYY